ncbi:hypothetical protein [Arthrobacter sp. KK5.5]|uniref:hypothetical protein n=1 Tax=Arthrobacter sp. KK5.5 TaxID=3373084 RepID=UPI003EE72F20
MIDSAITDLGGVGAQLLLAPILGISGFGIYRAMSNAAAPIRLLIAPLRPLFARRAAVDSLVGVYVGLVVAVCVAVASLVWLLLGIVASEDLRVGTLSELAQFAPIVGLFVGGTLLLHVYSAIGRISLEGHRILRARVLQTVSMGLLPVLAALSFGLFAALLAGAVAICVAAVIWTFAVRMR